ncbi:MAG: IPExxxVDY family protein [Bacteroidales bacterium]|nr:IPExxxVDY family protein [Bacteroidales bacterium]
MAKSIKLAFKPELEFQLIGISSHENDYHLSWAINKNIGLNLAKSKNLSIYNRQLKEQQEFSVFSFDNEDNFILFNLISNTSVNGFLFPEMRNIDFFLQIYGETDDKFILNLINKLNKIEIVSTSFIINPNNLKAPEKLLFN